MDNEQILNISLTVSEVNYVLSALGQRPFVEVSALITKIKTQGDAQCAVNDAAAIETANQSSLQ